MFELFCDQDGKWRWRLRATNNEVLATSEAYEGGVTAARDGITAACEAVEDAYEATDTVSGVQLAAKAQVV